MQMSMKKRACAACANDARGLKRGRLKVPFGVSGRVAVRGVPFVGAGPCTVRCFRLSLFGCVFRAAERPRGACAIALESGHRPMIPRSFLPAVPFLVVVSACGPSASTQENAAISTSADASTDAGPLELSDASFDAGRGVVLVDAAGVSSDAATAIDASTAADAGLSRSPLCAGASTAPFQAPTTCDALSGNTTTSRPMNSVYATSWFGCYRNASGSLVTDPSDNCEFACGNRGLCAAGLSGPECQAQLQWFSADADRFGCGTRIQVTNCENGRSVVLAALDRGPNCRSVEQAFGAPVVDMSWPAMTYLFEGRTYGGSDKKRVVIEVVAATATLGPVL